MFDPNTTKNRSSFPVTRSNLSWFWHSQAMIIFYICYLFALIYMFGVGEYRVLRDDLRGLGWLISAVLITGILVKDNPHSLDEQTSSVSHRQLYTQVGVILFCVIFTYYRQHNFIIKAITLFPVLPSVAIFLNEHSEVLSVAIQCLGLFLIPYLGLRFMGVRRRELGLRKGHLSWAMTVLWSLAPIAIIIWSMILKEVTTDVILNRIVSHSLGNGFFEEFLFRGALLTRLRRLWGIGNAVVISSLVFGLWHIIAELPAFGGSLPRAISNCILNQATFGVGMSYLFLKSRNLLPGSIVHVLVNVSDLI